MGGELEGDWVGSEGGRRSGKLLIIMGLIRGWRVESGMIEGSSGDHSGRFRMV